MIMIDWSALGLGLLAGAITSALFFAGLGVGMRLALRTERPIKLLILSAVMRIVAFLAVGWVVVGFVGPFAFVGFAAAFVVTRMIAKAIAQPAAPAGGLS